MMLMINAMVDLENRTTYPDAFSALTFFYICVKKKIWSGDDMPIENRE